MSDISIAFRVHVGVSVFVSVVLPCEVGDRGGWLVLYLSF